MYAALFLLTTAFVQCGGGPPPGASELTKKTYGDLGSLGAFDERFDQSKPGKPIILSYLCDPDLRGKKLAPLLPGLSELRDFGLSGARIMDGDLEPVGQLPNLQFLGLNGSTVTDEQLRELRSLKKLKILSLPWTSSIKGTGFIHLKDVGIEALNLHLSRVSEQGLANLKYWTRLRVLALSMTRLTDSGLQKLAAIPKLEILEIEYTHITDSGLKHIAKFPALKELNLEGTKVTDKGLGYLATIMSLEKVFIGFSEITDQGVKQFNLIRPQVKVENFREKGLKEFTKKEFQ